jgi:hypothetical protein
VAIATPPFPKRHLCHGSRRRDSVNTIRLPHYNWIFDANDNDADGKNSKTIRDIPRLCGPIVDVVESIELGLEGMIGRLTGRQKAERQIARHRRQSHAIHPCSLDALSCIGHL